MRRLLRLFSWRPTTPDSRISTRTPDGGRHRVTATYRAASHAPAQRGLHSVQMNSFLHQLTTEITVLRRELAWTRDENVRIKRALREWQSRVARRIPA